MASRQCDHCGGNYNLGSDLAGSLQSSARFCSKECRYDAHNEYRKILRQVNGMAEYLRRLQSLKASTKNQNNAAMIEEMLEAFGFLAVDSDYGRFDKLTDTIAKRYK